jgi:hypothetical protein
MTQIAPHFGQELAASGLNEGVGWSDDGTVSILPAYEHNRAAVEALLAAHDPLAVPVALPATISDRQFFQQLALDGEITEAEALAAVATGTVPAALVAVIESLQPSDQFAANMFLQGATVFERGHPMTLVLAALMGWNANMLDALWTNAAAL